MIEPPSGFSHPVRFSDLAESPYFAFTCVDLALVTEILILTDLLDHDGATNFRPTFIRAAPGLEVVKVISGKETVRPAESTIETAIE